MMNKTCKKPLLCTNTFCDCNQTNTDYNNSDFDFNDWLIELDDVDIYFENLEECEESGCDIDNPEICPSCGS